jgi:hypothetical protein
MPRIKALDPTPHCPHCMDRMYVAIHQSEPLPNGRWNHQTLRRECLCGYSEALEEEPHVPETM